MWTMHAAIHPWSQAVLHLFASVCCVRLLFSSAPLFLRFASVRLWGFAFKGRSAEVKLKSNQQMWTPEDDIMRLQWKIALTGLSGLSFHLPRSALICSMWSWFTLSPIYTSVRFCSLLPCCRLLFSALLTVHIPYLYSLPCLVVSLISSCAFSPVMWLHKKETYIQTPM